MKAVGLEKGSKADIPTIQKEYFQACAAAGELQYKINEFQTELKKLNDNIRNLNKTYTELLTEQRAAAASNSGGEGPSASPSQPGGR